MKTKLIVQKKTKTKQLSYRATNNKTKNFSLETVFTRNKEILKLFGSKYKEKGNTIASEGLADTIS